MRAATVEVRQLGTSLLVAAGASAADADTVVAHLLDADAMGLRSHGVMRVPQYLAEIEAGGLDPHGIPVVEYAKAGRASIDGAGTFGQVVGMRMAATAMDLARSTGIAMVSGRRMGHTGRVGAYPEWMATSGVIGIAVCTGSPSGHWVAPFGGREGRLATNPIAFAYPAGPDGPVVADFSTAATAEGVIRSLHHRGLQTPIGWLRDADGRPTTDPGSLYASPRGAIQPLGGDLGYRGTALGLLVEVLATLLAGDAVDDSRRMGSDLAIIAIEPGARFEDLAVGLSDHVRSSPTIEPTSPVLMPGDREQAARVSAGMSVEIDPPTWAALVNAAARAGIPGLNGLT